MSTHDQNRRIFVVLTAVAGLPWKIGHRDSGYRPEALERKPLIGDSRNDRWAGSMELAVDQAPVAVTTIAVQEPSLFLGWSWSHSKGAAPAPL